MRFNFKTIFSNTINCFYMKITFTHLDTQKTPKTSHSLKPMLNKRSNKNPEYHRSSKTGYSVHMMTSQDSQGEGRKLPIPK